MDTTYRFGDCWINYYISKFNDRIAKNTHSVSWEDNIKKVQHGDICFLDNEKYTNFIYNSKASIIIVNNSFKPQNPINATLIKVANPYSSFSKLINLFNKTQIDLFGISNKCDISTETSIGNKVYIGSFTSICKGVTIGNNVKIHANCYIGENVIIGDNTVIFPNVSIYYNCKIVRKF